MVSSCALRVLIASLFACSIFLGSPARSAPATDPTAAAATKVAQLLSRSGYTYTTHNKTTWSTELERKNIGKVRVIISVGGDIVVIFAILAKKANIQKTTQFLETLLSANHDYDYAKIGLDKDGDLFVRIDTPARVIDGQDLKSVIQQVANSSDELYAKVSGSIRR